VKRSSRTHPRKNLPPSALTEDSDSSVQVKRSSRTRQKKTTSATLTTMTEDSDSSVAVKRSSRTHQKKTTTSTRKSTITEDSDSSVPVKRRSSSRTHQKKTTTSLARSSTVTEDSDSSVQVDKRRQVARVPSNKKRPKNIPPPSIDGYTPKVAKTTDDQKEDSPKIHAKGKQEEFRKPKTKVTKTGDEKETDKDEESSDDNNDDNDDDDDDADVDSDDEDDDNENESSDDDDDDDDEKKKKKEENEENNNKSAASEGEEKSKKSKSDGKKRVKKKKAPMTASQRNRVAKKDVDVPSPHDDDKIGEAAETDNNRKSRHETKSNPKQLEEGSVRKSTSHPHKKRTIARGHAIYDLADLSSTTTDDVRSSIDERGESDASIRSHRQRSGRNRSSSELGISHEESRRSRFSRSESGKESESDSSFWSDSMAKIRRRSRSMSLVIEQVEEKFLGCLTPGNLFAILAVPMVITVGGYEFLIALGAKKGMKTFQVSGVEIMVQGFVLTLGAWLTKDGRECFAHEITWNWLFAFLNAALTICSQLLTVYSMTALPAAVSSSLCAIQPLGILILETITRVTTFRVSQCLAFKLPPIFFIVAGVALLSIDVLFAS